MGRKHRRASIQTQTHAAINPPTATRSTLEGKSITALTIQRGKNAEAALVLRVLCTDEAPAELRNNAAEMEMSRLSVLLAGVGEQQRQKTPERSDHFFALALIY